MKLILSFVFRTLTARCAPRRSGDHRPLARAGGRSGRVGGALLTLGLGLVATAAHAQTTGTLTGRIRTSEADQPLPAATVRVLEHPTLGTVADSLGRFVLPGVPTGPKHVEVSAVGYATHTFDVVIGAAGPATLAAVLKPAVAALDEVQVTGVQAGTARLADVSRDGLYAGRRSDVIPMRAVQANLAVAPARQVLARVAGLHVVELDGTGTQLSISARGLNPNRVQEFNTRQNGYDIAGDPLGYPEAYYTPPLEGVHQIEIVRGAAALQYGPQFGGLLNFRLKQPPTDRKLALTVRQTAGSFGLSSTFASVGGTVGAWSYYGFGSFKRADGWRRNNGLRQGVGYGAVGWQANPRLKLRLEMTAAWFQMQQPGGRTDAEYAADPRGSSRARNWFETQWYMPALVADYDLGPRTTLNVRAVGLLAGRQSLGNLSPINQPDDAPRTLLADDYRSGTLEARLGHQYTLFGDRMKANLLTGVRAYYANTRRQQGFAPDGTGPDFRFAEPLDQLAFFRYHFPNTNAAFFAENVFYLTPRLSLTPGARVEYIRTAASGYYRPAPTAAPLPDHLTRSRAFPLFGLSAGYQLTPATDFYANVSQKYAAVNFNDMRVDNPNLKVDPNLRDVRGWAAEAGYRGSLKDVLTFDVGAFYVAYHDRIGLLNGNFRTNVADAASRGVEAYAEVHPVQAFGGSVPTVGDVTLFGAYGFTDARYVRAPQAAVEGKRLELAPRHVLRGGLNYRRGGLSVALQGAYTGAVYTDPTNARFPNASATIGLIPAYTVYDLNAGYSWKRFTLALGINNLTDARYFTRRATGYPGPGILPADARAFFGTLEVRL